MHTRARKTLSALGLAAYSDTDSTHSALIEGSGRRGGDRIFDRDILETFPGADPVAGVVETAVAVPPPRAVRIAARVGF